MVLIDDVLATGGTMTAAADLCQRAGYQLQALVALMDLNIVANYSWRSLRVRAAIAKAPPTQSRLVSTVTSSARTEKRAA